MVSGEAAVLFNLSHLVPSQLIEHTPAGRSGVVGPRSSWSAVFNTFA